MQVIFRRGILPYGVQQRDIAYPMADEKLAYPMRVKVNVQLGHYGAVYGRCQSRKQFRQSLAKAGAVQHGPQVEKIQLNKPCALPLKGGAGVEIFSDADNLPPISRPGPDVRGGADELSSLLPDDISCGADSMGCPSSSWPIGSIPPA